MRLQILTECPSCHSHEVKLLGDYGDTALCDDYKSKSSVHQKFPLRLYHCNNCSLAFIDCVVDPSEIYDNYVYLTQSSPGLNAHFERYASDVVTRLNLPQGSTIVDIGGNDGTLLSSFSNLESFRLVNIEPSPQASSYCADNFQYITTINQYFTPELVDEISADISPDLILMNNMLANIPPINSFVDCLDLFCSPTGVVVIESSYLLDMVSNNVIDFVYHEHLYYFSVTSLSYLFSAHNFQLFDVQHVGTKGGSLRYYFSRPGLYPVSSKVSDKINIEKDFFASDSYLKWFHAISSSLSSIHLPSITSSSSDVCIYGASATTTTLLNLLPRSWKIASVVDDNPLKHGKYAPFGQDLVVQKFDFLSNNKPGIIVIAAWRFRSLILPKLRLIPGYNPLIVVPLPSPVISFLHDIEL